MDTYPLFLALAVVVLAIVAGLSVHLFMRRRAVELPYKRMEQVFRPTDPSFSGMLLEQVLGEKYYVLSKVNLVNLIKPRDGLSSKAYAAALESVYDRQVEFAVCDLHSREIVGVIELAKARRDKFVARALAAAGIPVARVRPRKSYAPEEVRQEIMSALAA